MISGSFDLIVKAAAVFFANHPIWRITMFVMSIQAQFF
jgi:hypothetical protein